MASNGKEYHYAIDDLNAEDSRRLIGIMAEFIDGFSLVANMGPMVSVFGSARSQPDNPYFQKAEKLGGMLAKEGVGMLTGGGPGIMEAANKGAFEAGGKSVGVSISLPNEQASNRYITDGIELKHFFVRKVMLIKYSHAYVIFPGGYGTFDELFESLTLIRTQRISPFPMVLYGTEYWGPLLDWLNNVVKENGCIDDDDLAAISITDDLAEVVEICKASVVVNSG